MGKNPDQLRELVPEELVECLRKSELTLPDLKGYPHLRRVAGVVYFFLDAREKAYQEGANQSQRLAEKALDSPETSQFDLPFDQVAHYKPWLNLYFTLEHRDKKLHMLVARELDMLDDPFGFGPGVTAAILEMANYSHQVLIEELNRGGGVEHIPSPTEAFPAVMIDLFEEHRNHMPFDFSAMYRPGPSRFFRQIFPPGVAEEMRQLVA